MSRRPHLVWSHFTLAARIAACCMTAMLALAGCGAGQTAQTASQAAAVDGTSADLGALALRDVLIPYAEDHNGTYPSGSDVPVQLTIINQTTNADTLVSLSTPAARQVLLEGATTIPAGVSVSGVTDHGGPATPTAASANPLDVDELRVMLVDILRPVRPGLNTELTFVFQNAGPVTLSVPMGPPSESERAPLDNGGH
ncbi:MAG: copper chaperone PCu(A)C [Pseudonocardiaceae bacterium]